MIARLHSEACVLLKIHVLLKLNGVALCQTSTMPKLRLTLQSFGPSGPWSG
jgi:hypothetical protein